MSLTVREKAEGGKDLRTLWASVRVTCVNQSPPQTRRASWVTAIVVYVKNGLAILLQQ